MIRRAFTMRLKPDSSTEYRYHHDNLWPELAAEIERSGIASITTFQRDLDLFLISEIRDEAAWDRLWNSEIHKQWAEVMQPLMHLREDGIVDAGNLVEVFHFSAGGRANGEASARYDDESIAGGCAEAIASEFALGESDGENDENCVATIVAEYSNGNGLASEVVGDPLAELIAAASVEPAPATPLNAPAAPAVAPAAQPARKKRVLPKKPARKRSAKKKPARKSKRKSPGKRPAPAVKKSKKKPARKKAPKKKATARKSKPKKAARKKSAKKRARK